MVSICRPGHGPYVTVDVLRRRNLRVLRLPFGRAIVWPRHRQERQL